MKTLARCSVIALTFTAGLVASVNAYAQAGTMQMPQQTGAPGQTVLSPPAMASANLGGKTVTIHYGAPSLRGRVMIGAHDPYDKVWRTGANAATTFVTDTDLKVGDLMVPAGPYTLYTLPEPPGTPWLLILNKQTGQWGTVYNQAMDLGRTPMKAKTLDAPQETLSISFENARGKTAELHIRWAKVDEWVTVEAK
jgi:hypothetical protein